jgi:two-component system, OmpR family, response regulator
MRMAQMRILIVEDHAEMARLIANQINGAGFVADCVGRIDDAQAALEVYDYPIMLLDRRVPDGDGLRALAEFRRARPGVKIIVVSAMNGKSDKVDGLDSGADDYLAKPFDSDELMARIRACLRRPGEVAPPRMTLGCLSFDLSAHQAFASGAPFELTRTEALFIECLMRRAERFVAHSTITEEIHGPGEEVSMDAQRMLVMRLRHKLKNARLDVELLSGRGIGYMLRRTRA